MLPSHRQTGIRDDQCNEYWRQCGPGRSSSADSPSVTRGWAIGSYSMRVPSGVPPPLGGLVAALPSAARRGADRQVLGRAARLRVARDADGGPLPAPDGTPLPGALRRRRPHRPWPPYAPILGLLLFRAHLDGAAEHAPARAIRTDAYIGTAHPPTWLGPFQGNPPCRAEPALNPESGRHVPRRCLVPIATALRAIAPAIHPRSARRYPLRARDVRHSLAPNPRASSATAIREARGSRRRAAPLRRPKRSLIAAIGERRPRRPVPACQADRLPLPREHTHEAERRETPIANRGETRACWMRRRPPPWGRTSPSQAFRPGRSRSAARRARRPLP
jgi:hypothetical protein